MDWQGISVRRQTAFSTRTKALFGAALQILEKSVRRQTAFRPRAKTLFVAAILAPPQAVRRQSALNGGSPARLAPPFI